MKIKITSDSTCDLSSEQIERYDIGIFRLSVILGENSYKDGEISPQDIFDFVKDSGVLPKTAAGSISEYGEFFTDKIQGYDALIHIDISAQASSSYSAAAKAAEAFGGKVFVVDSKALSTGQGLLVLKACDLAAEGQSAEQIVQTLNALRPKVNTSFVPDSLTYLHKGGRCSLAALIGAKVLKLHPLISENEDGQLVAPKKYMGGMLRCIRSYIEDLKVKYPHYDKTRCFITHSSADKELVDLAKELVAQSFDFDEVCETVAGSIVTSHCGRNTLGVLFISE
ncbi:MAG: DegV family protein [Clostridiales bacterium]|nr:DegV family protein [Clostridiales bacterium]